MEQGVVGSLPPVNIILLAAYENIRGYQVGCYRQGGICLVSSLQFHNYMQFNNIGLLLQQLSLL